MGEAEQHIQRQPPHGSGGIKLLSNGYEGNASLIHQLYQLGKIHPRARQAIYLVDHNNIDFLGLDICQQLF